LLAEVAALFEADARAKKVELVVRVADDVPASVIGDPTRVRQVVLNLASNALKFTHSGSIELALALEQSGGGAEQLRFGVRDTGIGIAREAQDLVFAPFAQADATTTRRFGGTGLGLAICKRLVVLMGGEIGLESELGRGSHFWFTLPCVTARSERGRDGASLLAPLSPEQRARKLVLVAEDNPVNRFVVRLMLEKLGYRAELVDDGRLAVEARLRGECDLVLMDQQMPVLDGVAAAREIRALERERDLPHVPIIAMTANAMVENKDDCLSAGMDAFLCKPVELDELARVLDARLSEPPAALPARRGRGRGAGVAEERDAKPRS
jgi:CheY-like chemotaxis protein